MNTRILIICDSTYHGNTLKLATAMANQLNCRLANLDEAEGLPLNNFEAIGWGSGIFFGRHSARLRALANSLENMSQDAFIFSSHGSPVLGKYHQELEAILTSKGRRIIGNFSVKGYDCTGPFTIVGGGNKGRPNEKDQRRAAQFVNNLFPQFQRKDLYSLVAKPRPLTENKPNVYKVKNGSAEVTLVGDLVTVETDRCSGCGSCIKRCPLFVFELVDAKSTPMRELDCVQCSLCQSFCPQRAISLHGKWTDAIRVAKRHAHRTISR